MGTCWNCGSQVTLSKDQTECDNCHETLYYYCNNCKEGFEIKSKKGKLEVCPFCSYFKCPNCGVCSWSCKRYDWEKEFLKILRPEITQAGFPNLPEKVRKIVDYIELQKISIDRLNCPERGVPISYAKNRIKSLLAKFEGFRVKDVPDREAFLKRFDEISKKGVGSICAISNVREKGSYGQEYRDAFNLTVCLGKYEIKKVKHPESDNYYDVFVRCEKGHCKYLNIDNLIINECPNCKSRYPRGKKYCPKCPSKQKGKNKGELWKLKERLNNIDTCQCYRGDFIRD